VSAHLIEQNHGRIEIEGSDRVIACAQRPEKKPNSYDLAIAKTMPPSLLPDMKARRKFINFFNVSF
jgi:hypothetical protein